jgi:hypothetical protein
VEVTVLLVITDELWTDDDVVVLDVDVVEFCDPVTVEVCVVVFVVVVSDVLVLVDVVEVIVVAVVLITPSVITGSQATLISLNVFIKIFHIMYRILYITVQYMIDLAYVLCTVHIRGSRFLISNFLQFAIDGKNKVEKTKVEKLFFFIYMSSFAEMSFFK